MNTLTQNDGQEPDTTRGSSSLQANPPFKEGKFYDSFKEDSLSQATLNVIKYLSEERDLPFDLFCKI